MTTTFLCGTLTIISLDIFILFCRVTFSCVSLSLFSVFSWLFNVLFNVSHSCEIFSPLFLLWLFCDFCGCLFLSFVHFLFPVSSVLLLFSVVFIFSRSWDFTHFLIFRFFKFVFRYMYFFFGRDNYFAVKIDWLMNLWHCRFGGAGISDTQYHLI